jgi:hypothetical protein
MILIARGTETVAATPCSKSFLFIVFPFLMIFQAAGLMTGSVVMEIITGRIYYITKFKYCKFIGADYVFFFSISIGVSQ